ncbi:MAG: nucleotidyltransferase domain-containing protein [Gemmatimonadetes bacterium]|nr:nucleotidyltransferase domain-containing protein [Gemmatimonadota bacterium]MYF72989.1 nucleotidyltransferase domain-containing protein [Gemmatimonadota bacterium]MYK53032.1 nucleotidyltransferase domain-containing protein [Gemmatimonadota bacterium]
MLDTVNLPEHRRVFDSLLRHFRNIDGVIGLFVSGSQATGEMDEQSDLDLGVVLDSQKIRNAVWSKRWNWATEPWFHRFDADHIKEYFVIYLFEPCVKADINLYIEEDLPGWKGGPFQLIWTKSDRLEEWCQVSNDKVRRENRPTPNEELLIHEDERLWAWLVYVVLHTKRGEYYSAAWSFADLRNIVEKWHAYLQGEHKFTPRQFEQRMPSHLTRRFATLFPQPTRNSLKKAYYNLAELHEEQRREIGSRLGLTWKISEYGICRVKDMIGEI